MAVINGTITGVSELRAKSHPGRKAYLITAEFAAYTGAADTATVTGVGAAVLAHTRNGKTVTLRGSVPIAPGYDTNSQAVYFTGTSVQAGTVSSDDLTGQLSAADGTELTTSTAAKGVELCVIVDEA
jgi:uncharacterized phage protein gp47/JayE